MCGIAGFIDINGSLNEQETFENLKKMSDSLFHRGPDSSGDYYDQEYAIGFTHRRLAILDLSQNGNQPMFSFSGRYVLIFNGEIYNHIILRNELNSFKKDIKWNGNSDTETLLSAFEIWGLEKTLDKISGMFSFGLWDRKEKFLYLARDRVGEKPLYYGWSKNFFLFTSELKSLEALDIFNREINPKALHSILTYNNVRAPDSIYKNIYKLTPGSYLKINCKKNQRISRESVSQHEYWSIYNAANQDIIKKYEGSDNDAVNDLEHLVVNSVEKQMISDVPIGAFLSGGIDSSLIVSIMQKLSKNPINTYTIGFENKQFNEAIFAKEIASYLGTSHTELYVNEQDALDVIPKLPFIYDEPFADSSQIPTYLVSQITSKNVKVALSGDGGDELFGGYNRYFWSSNIWNKIKFLPLSVRAGLSKLILIFPANFLNVILSIILKIFPDNYNIQLPGDKMHKVAKILDSYNPEEIYNKLVILWTEADEVINNFQYNSSIINSFSAPKFDEYENNMMYTDFVTYLPDDILTKVDRAAMAVSLETRIPLLDQQIIEFAWKLPLNMKIRNGEGKWILRQLLNRHIPSKITNRPKMGFGVPLSEWLKGPLREWAENLLDKKKIDEQGFFNSSLINKKWQEHIEGKRNWHHQLWTVLSIQSWLNR